MIWIFLIFSHFLGFFQARAFSPLASHSECPKISPQNGIKLNEVSGTWRLGYMYIDQTVDLDEETTCGIAEFAQMNETKMELVLYIDSRKDESTIDRYIKEFEVTVLTPGEWLIHTAFQNLEFIHVRVIGFFGGDHLILTFCGNPFFQPENLFESESNGNPPENRFSDFSNNLSDIFKAETSRRLLKDLTEFDANLEERLDAEKMSKLFRGKRHVEDREEEPSSKSSAYLQMLNQLDRLSGENHRKHLWTLILVKNNRISALDFVENASLLMKYGFKVSEGQLIGFGSCSLTK